MLLKVWNCIQKNKFKNKHTGTIGDFGVVSFNGNKIVTSGNGGAFIDTK